MSAVKEKQMETEHLKAIEQEYLYRQFFFLIVN